MAQAIMMRATSTGGNESGLAQIDVPKDGNLIGVEWASQASYDTSGDFQNWQLSFGASLSITNDSRSIISQHSLGLMNQITAAGEVMGGDNSFTPMEIPVGQGERIFLHSNASASFVGSVFCTLHFDFTLDRPSVRRR